MLLMMDGVLRVISSQTWTSASVRSAVLFGSIRCMNLPEVLLGFKSGEHESRHLSDTDYTVRLHKGLLQQHQVSDWV